jgi:RNA polymerase sigma-70 factor (ECF subfamily)
MGALAFADIPSRAPRWRRVGLPLPATSLLTRLRGHDRRPPAPSPGDEAELVRRLRAGDEAAFEELVRRHHAALTRVASMYVRDRAVVEEVVQETWLAALTGLDRFEERSSLKTWLFRILANRARTRAVREARSVPFSALAAAEAADDEPAVDPDRFLDPRGPSPWAAPPSDWRRLPEERLLAGETLSRVAAAIEALPPAQREVIRLRDVEGWSAAEVAGALEISDGNQRVLLHRARAKVRAALEDYLEPA